MSTRPCTHRHGSRHRHARRACHQPCSCRACRAAHARYQRQRVHADKNGTPFKVPVADVADRLAWLEAHGVRRGRVAALTGVSENTLKRIARRQQAGVYAITAELIFGVDTANAPTVDATGTHRRIQALARVGHTFGAVEQRFGLAPGSLSKFLAQKRVTRATADRINTVYEALYAYDGGSARTADRAARAGWLPPRAWTDDTIDQPVPPKRTVRPVTDAELQVLRGYHREYERLRANKLPIPVYIREQDARYRGVMRRARTAARPRLAGVA